jgi:hypothetical protein
LQTGRDRFARPGVGHRHIDAVASVDVPNRWIGPLALVLHEQGGRDAEQLHRLLGRHPVQQQAGLQGFKIRPDTVARTCPVVDQEPHVDPFLVNSLRPCLDTAGFGGVLGSGFQKYGDDIAVAAEPGIVDGRLAAFVDGVNVGALDDEHLGRLGAVGQCGAVKWGHALGVGRGN